MSVGPIEWLKGNTRRRRVARVQQRQRMEEKILKEITSPRNLVEMIYSVEQVWINQ